MRSSRLLRCVAALPLVAALATGTAHAGELSGALLAQATAMGILKVDCSLDGALVSVDGAQVGVTPLLSALPVGEHLIEVTMSGYATHTETVNIPEDMKVVVRAELELVAAQIALRVKPDGAIVELDGVEIGTTPDVQLDMVSPGMHHISVRKNGYATHTQDLSVSARQQITLSIDLQATAGILRIGSEPAGASVYADGELLGETPLEKPDMAIGLHALRLQADGHAEAFVTVHVVLGEEAVVDHVFTTSGGALKVIPAPETATVSVDNYELGEGRLTLESITPGVHSVTVSATDFLEFSEDVLVHEGRTQTVRATLEPTAMAVARNGTTRPTTGNAKKKAPIIVAIVGAVTTGTIIAMAAANTEGSEPDPPSTDYVFQLP